MATPDLKLCGKSEIANQLEDAYSQILEATSLINVLRQSDGSAFESADGDLSMFCEVVSRMLSNAGKTVEMSTRAIRKSGGAS